VLAVCLSPLTPGPMLPAAPQQQQSDDSLSPFLLDSPTRSGLLLLYFQHMVRLSLCAHPDLSCLGLSSYLPLLAHFAFLDRSSAPLVAAQLWHLLDARFAHTHYAVAGYFHTLWMLAPVACSRVVVEAMLHPDAHARVITSFSSHQHLQHQAGSQQQSRAAAEVVSPRTSQALEAITGGNSTSKGYDGTGLDTGISNSSSSSSTADGGQRSQSAPSSSIDPAQGYKRFASLWKLLGELYPSSPPALSRAPSAAPAAAAGAGLASSPATPVLTQALLLILEALDDNRPGVRLVARTWLSDSLVSSHVHRVLDPLLAVLAVSFAVHITCMPH